MSLSMSGELHGGGHCGFSSKVLSGANVIPCISGLEAFHRHDALGHSRGVPASSVDQPPSVLNCHHPLLLLPWVDPAEFHLDVRLPKDSAEDAHVLATFHPAGGRQDGR